MVKIDANQEVIALIRMAIDNDNKSRTLQAQSDIEDHETNLEKLSLNWTFGSRSGTRLDSRALEEKLAPGDHNFISFDERLRSFIAYYFPEEALRYEDMVYVCFQACHPFMAQLMFNRSNVSNVSQSSISPWRTGQSVTTFYVATRISINVSVTTVLSSIMTALGPRLHVSVHYYGVDYRLER